jgi:hypothetical protein
MFSRASSFTSSSSFYWPSIWFEGGDVDVPSAGRDFILLSYGTTTRKPQKNVSCGGRMATGDSFLQQVFEDQRRNACATFPFDFPRLVIYAWKAGRNFGAERPK